METVKIVNYIIMILFFVCYAYQILFIPIAVFKKKKTSNTPQKHRFAVLIAARNEEAVIGNLIKSLKCQSYPERLVDIYVAADNCTDKTAETAEKSGAAVFERTDKTHTGKGYVLKFLLENIKKSYDAYIVFDADNVASPNFITEINKIYSDGYEVVTGCRNSKNHGDNWISAGYALWFLREAQYLNRPRFKLGSSCGISGTGFMVSDRILKKFGGWSFFCLTEDIEFMAHCIVNGIKIGYCEKAEFYDEQPVLFSQSWRQRKRWAKGYLQVLSRYGTKLFSGMVRGSFSCFDMTMSIMPATVLTLMSIAVNALAIALNVFNAAGVGTVLLSLGQSALNLYATLFILGAVTTLTERKKIHCSAAKKALYTFTFPIFMLTYIPVSVSAFFTKVEWKHIEHTKNIGIAEIDGKAE